MKNNNRMILSFREYLPESESVRARLLKKYPKTEVHFLADEDDKNIFLKMILVPYKKRRQGIGTKFMKDLIALAKEKGKTVTLVPSDLYAEEGDMDINQLKRWYKSLGFKETGDPKGTLILKGDT
jgi:GNAT superfamily N-acetyltransferase